MHAKRYARWLVGALLSVVLSGCPGSVQGTVSGIGLSVADTLFYPVKDAGKTTNLVVLIGDKANLCTTLKANRIPRSATAMQFVFYRWADDVSTQLAPDVGEYTVVPFGTNITRGGNYATAEFIHNDANCTNTISDNAAEGKSGLIKLAAVNAAINGSATGSFDVTFGSDRVTGTFSGAYCDAAPQKPSCE